ncbi:MAG: polynucleotide adenylyltransferase PcnB, partial [Glaciecola sp.]
DFLLLRGEIEGGELYELAQWWTDFQEVDSDTRKRMIDDLRAQPGPRNSRRRKKPKRKPN